MSSPVLRSISARATFRDLRAGRRARRGLVTVTWVPPDRTQAAQAARVGYAVGRRAGGAVVRNRVRRRLRAAMSKLSLPAGAYLVSASGDAATAPWSQLCDDLASAVATVTDERS